MEAESGTYFNSKMLKNLYSSKFLVLFCGLCLLIVSLYRIFYLLTIKVSWPWMDNLKKIYNFTPNFRQTASYHIGLGIFSVERPGAPDYLYAELASIYDSLFINQSFLFIDRIHIFDGTYNKSGSQVKFLKYTRSIQVHPIDSKAYADLQHKTVHRKASLNYLLTLKFLTRRYPNADAYLILEDDIVFDPEAAKIIWTVLNYVKTFPLFLVDGYVRGPQRNLIDENSESSFDVVIPLEPGPKCCSQSFLLSYKAAKQAIPLIEASLNGSAEYLPLDVYLTKSLSQIENFRIFDAKKCWVQHIGKPHLGLGEFHRGCSRMHF
jgi:hypothetical protein